MSATIKLQTSDGKCLAVSREAANHMGTVRHLIESLEGAEDDTVLPLPQVKSRILEPIIKWCEYHKKDEILPVVVLNKPKVRKEIEDPYDKEFVNVPKHQLFDYILAANYLAIENLLELTCKAVSDMMKGKTPQEIREQFDLDDDINIKDMIHPAKRVAK